jgi:hypothetical protein
MAINTELLGKDKSLEALKLLLEHFKEQYNLSPEQLLDIAGGKTAQEGIPITAFSNGKLSSLEIIVKYLKENFGKTYHEIGVLLNRDDRTIWSTYNNSIKKHKTALEVKPTSLFIPFTIFASRKHSVLESLVIYLKDNLGYSFNRISVLVLKDYQTIYTTYKRGKSKQDAK